MESKNTYLQIGEAAAFLGVCIATLRNWEKKGKIRVSRNQKNGYRIYRKDYLEELLAKIRGL